MNIENFTYAQAVHKIKTKDLAMHFCVSFCNRKRDGCSLDCSLMRKIERLKSGMGVRMRAWTVIDPETIADWLENYEPHYWGRTEKP